MLTGSAIANTSRVNDREDHDFYPTPKEATIALMDFLIFHNLISQNDTIWEPACGDGAMSKVLESYGCKVYSYDLRDSGFGRGGVDYLSRTINVPINWTITNPPFKISESFIKKAVLDSPNSAFLVKSQYWHAAKRRILFENHRPAYVLPLSWRPDFMGGSRGGSPTMDVGWAVWINGITDTK